MTRAFSLRPLAATLLAALTLAGCAKEAAPVEEVRPVRTTMAGSTAEAGGPSFAGEVRARHETQLAFRVGGKVIERMVDAGARVRSGQPIARLDATDYGLDLSAKQAAVAAAESDLTQQAADLARYRELLGRNFISRSQVERQENAVNAARSRLEQARAQLGASRNQTAYATLTAPADGVISTISVEPGMVVAAGQAVARLAADGEREVAFQVPENALAQIRKAPALEIGLWSGNARYRGVLRELAADADPATRTYAARALIMGAGDAAQLGMSATVTLPSANRGDAMRLPLTALLDEGGKHFVWIVDPKTSKVGRKAVTVAAVGSDWVAVSGGVRPGERVVTAGVHLLRDGQRVTLLKE